MSILFLNFKTSVFKETFFGIYFSSLTFPVPCIMCFLIFCPNRCPILENDSFSPLYFKLSTNNFSLLREEAPTTTRRRSRAGAASNASGSSKPVASWSRSSWGAWRRTSWKTCRPRRRGWWRPSWRLSSVGCTTSWWRRHGPRFPSRGRMILGIRLFRVRWIEAQILTLFFFPLLKAGMEKNVPNDCGLIFLT